MSLLTELGRLDIANGYKHAAPMALQLGLGPGY